MTSALDIGRIMPGDTFSVAETAMLLGVNRTTVYRLSDLDYVYDAEGRRRYTGYSILKRKNTFTDPKTGRAVMIDRKTGRVSYADGRHRDRRTAAKQTI